MEAIIDLAKHLANTTDEAGRKRLSDGFRNLSYSLETPDDTLQRIIYYHLQISAARIAVDLKLFDMLAASEDPMTVEELQRKTGAAPLLLGRLLRYLASVAMIAEVEKDTFTSTNVTEALAIPGNQAGIHFQFDSSGPLYQALPEFLAQKNYQDITDNIDTVAQVAYKIPSVPVFVWLAQNPQHADHFNQYMMHRRKGQPRWLEVYPVEQETKEWDPDRAVFVDIGGNLGHQCADFKAKYPNLPCKVILQDLAQPISQALNTPGVQNMVYDAFEPQPIQGAKFYYLRHVLHDWPDDKCRVILRNVAAAMGPDSVILLDEMVPPDEHVHWRTTQIDITMMAALASRERTYSQWTDLLESVGLHITDVYTYQPSIYESVMRVVRK